jgi:putative SOS response-associated peptidase YedK
MCGRVRLPQDYSEIKIRLRFDDRAPAPNLRASWNIAPTQDLLTAVRDPAGGARSPVLMRWGLVPSWAKDIKIGVATFNARADTLTAKPAFRGAWRAGRRCLVVTDGFYEWRRGDKQPFAIARSDAPFTVMAGLWEDWRSPAGERIRSCTIITTESNALIAPLHDRMPVLLAEADWPLWLGETPADEAALRALLRPYPSEQMTLWPIGRAVGNVRNDGPELVAPAPAA